MSKILPLSEDAQRAAVDAILYALNRVQTDADFRWHMLSTETFDLLIKAEALIRGESEEAVRDRRVEWARTHASPVAQLVEARKRIEALEAACGDFVYGRKAALENFGGAG